MRLEEASRGASRLTLRLAFDESERLRTQRCLGLEDRGRTLLPGLSRHLCGESADIWSELADTEVAHLFEHVTLELMALAGAPRHLRGRTHWDFGRDGEGVFWVELAFDEPRSCRAAAAEALDVVAYLLEGGVAPDISEIAGRISEVRDAARGDL